MVVIGGLSSMWAFAICGAIVMAKCMQAEFCTGYAEALQNFLDAMCSGLNCCAFIYAAVELTSSQPDVNQGDSILESMLAGDATKMQVGMASTFINFVLFSGSIGLNLKLYTSK
jgi:hypothetical protein